MARRGLCHCGAKILGDGRCAFKCSVFADPAWLSLQESKRKERDAHGRREERNFITQEDLRRIRRVVNKFDKIGAHMARKAARMRSAIGGGR